MALQVANLLATNEDLPDQVRSAIAEGRLEEAGLMLMDAFDLTCAEAGELVDQSLCGEGERGSDDWSAVAEIC
jgi:hypothetical protein